MLDVLGQDAEQFAHRRRAACHLDTAACLLASGDEAAHEPGAGHVHFRYGRQVDLDRPGAVKRDQAAIVLQQGAETVVAPGAG
ncbi:hypothetical protein D3C72_1867530 [compost metagenome]